MRAFQHAETPLRVYCGPDSLDHLSRELERLGCRRAALVTGASLGRSAGQMDMLRAALGERCAGIFSDVQVHSPLPAVLAATAALRDMDADAVVAVGGGSTIVTARAAAILLAEAGDIASLSTSIDERGRLHSPKLMAGKIPQLVVPTTPTTAAVKAGSAVYDPTARRRRALFDPKTRAQAIFVHPDLIAPVPRRAFVYAGLNTLAMAVEGLMSRGGDPLADGLLMHALRLCARALASPHLDEDAEVRAELVLGALLCGRGTDFTSGGITSALGHAVGARHEIENGLVNAVTLPGVLRYNGDAARSGIEKTLDALVLIPSAGQSASDALLGALDRLFDTLGIPRRLRDANVPHDALGELAQLAMQDWFLRGNARQVTDAADLQKILDDAW